MLMNEGLVRDMAKAMQDRTCLGVQGSQRPPRPETPKAAFGPGGSEPSVLSAAEAASPKYDEQPALKSASVPTRQHHREKRKTERACQSKQRWPPSAKTG